MSTEKKYKCPYCELRAIRSKLVRHVEEKHDDMIPENQVPEQVVFNSIYHKDHGSCVICKRDTEWNQTTGKYNRYCGRPECKKALREKYSANMIKRYNTDNILNDPDMQKKMLEHRKISGKYVFSDGGSHTYTGSYEKKFLEFLDKVMNIPSTDIMTPGPTYTYEYDGKALFWITDLYYIPANLVIEVKDGGDNPNTRPMDKYREKQLAKEDMIKSLNKVNYLRLTNNNFKQFLSILADLKDNALSGKEKFVYSINEHMGTGGVGGMTPAWCSDLRLVFAKDKETLDKNFFLSTGDIEDSLIFVDSDNKLKKKEKKDFVKEYTVLDIFKKQKDGKYLDVLKTFQESPEGPFKKSYLLEALSDTGLDVILLDDIYLDESFTIDTFIRDHRKALSSIEETFNRIENFIELDIFTEDELEHSNSLLEYYPGFKIKKDPNGYFLLNESNQFRLPSVKSIREISSEDITFLEQEVLK